MLFIFVLLLVASAFFSAAETAFTSVSPSSIHRLVVGGDRRARILDALRCRKELVISTLLIGNTVANVAASSVATATMLDLLGPGGLVVSTASITCVVLLFSEVLPKTYALQNPEKISLCTARMVSYCSFVLSPLSITFRFAVDCILRILGIQGEQELVSAADAMRNLISMHNGKGTMSQQDLDMLSSVLDLAQTEISQVMTHRKNLFALDIDEEVDVLLKQIFQSTHSRIPIWQKREESIIGVLHVRDVTDLVREKSGNVTKNDIYSIMNKPWFIPDTTPLSVQLHNFRKKRRHLALVVDEYGTLQGAVTLEDILEEIVGDISDEHDIVPESLITAVNENEYHIAGEAPIRDVNRELRWGLPEDASTVAGLILHNIERIPEEGEVFSLHGFTFKILEKSGNTISLLSVRPADTDEGAPQQ
ncbi:HlyC/CorC family transporter [Candidatus Anaplasma sp. TIGMIC]|uniref:HlyC/CorC family transporter n=1 Tax=Candidatus Anaplasma sp. TIGMIC TaxID=3020713 RepID=UPI00232ACFBE|nr:CNNM domain-containing protein [Candidatus Anaplasma sp. TIGMIC]MDB1135048.1 CNNM domain-containing protein [Candidatus Anaplasma sp. TIGMIC]